MAYCTLDDLKKAATEKVLIQLTDDERTNSINEDIVTSAIASASDKMDAVLSVRYTETPLEPVPQLADVCCDIALYELYSRRQRGTTESVKERYQDAMKWLAMVRDRKANIQGVEEDKTGTFDRPGKITVAKGNSGFNWGAY